MMYTVYRRLRSRRNGRFHGPAADVEYPFPSKLGGNVATGTDSSKTPPCGFRLDYNASVRCQVVHDKLHRPRRFVSTRGRDQ